MKKGTRRVGRFQLSAKGRKGRKDAFRRSDKLINVWPSSSGAGRKLTDKQKAKAGLIKKAQGAANPLHNMRWTQYGLPALAGLALGGLTGGSRLGLLGALLGAGAGHYLFTPQRQVQLYKSLQDLLGTGAGTGVGSSAEPSAPAPTFVSPAAVDASIDRAAQEYINAGYDPEDAYREAANQTFQNMAVHDMGARIDGQPYTPGLAAKRGIKRIPNIDQLRKEIDIRSMQTGHNPYEGILYGTPLWAVSSAYNLARGQPGLDLAFAAPHATRAAKAVRAGQGLSSLKSLATPAYLKSLPGTMLNVQSVMDLVNIAGMAANAPKVDPNAPGFHWSNRADQMMRYGGEVFGRAHLRDVYGPNSQLSAPGKVWRSISSYAGAPIAAAVAQGDAARATNLAKRRAAARGLYQRSPQTGEYLQGDRAAKYQRSLINRASLGSKPIEWIRNPIGAQYNALRNAWNWWTR